MESQPTHAQDVNLRNESLVQSLASLNLSLRELGLPARLLTWAERHELRVLRDLVLQHPDSLKQAKNLGRKSIQSAHEVVLKNCGISWAAARAALLGEVEDPSNDSEWAAQLEIAMTIPLTKLELPARARSFASAQGIVHVGELWLVLQKPLGDVPNLGRKSLRVMRSSLTSFIQAIPTDGRSALTAQLPSTLLEAWREIVGKLPQKERLVLTRRASRDEDGGTLHDIGSLLNVTRERARQLETNALKRLEKFTEIRDHCRLRLETITGGAIVPIQRIAEDPWFEGVSEDHKMFRYVLERFVGSRWSVVKLKDNVLLSPIPSEEIRNAFHEISGELKDFPFPVTEHHLRDHLRRRADPVAPGLDAVVFSVVEADLGFEQRGDERWVLGFADTVEHRMLLRLRSSPVPLSVRQLQEEFGRCSRLPDGALRLGNGLLGVAEHFPDIESWRSALVPHALAVMEEDPADRQWSVFELWDDVTLKIACPEWMNAWHLGALLKQEPSVRWLGRLRVVLVRSQTTERLQYRELLEKELVDAGGPLDQSELFFRVREHTGARDVSLVMILQRWPFAKIDKGRWGLIERDVPGGVDALAQVRATIAKELTARNVGMYVETAVQIVNQLSVRWSAWSPELVSSALRLDPQFRLAPGARVGLASWESVRVVPLYIALQNAVVHAGGTLAMSDGAELLGALVGRPVSRASLVTYALNAGINVYGEWLSVESADADDDVGDD